MSVTIGSGGVLADNITSPDGVVALGAAFHSTFDDDGTMTTGTYTPQLVPSNWKIIRNSGNFTFAAPAIVAADQAYTMVVYVLNIGTPGTITMSGFSRVTGDSFTTTVGHVFFVYITVFGTGAKIANVVAAQ